VRDSKISENPAGSKNFGEQITVHPAVGQGAPVPGVQK